MHPFNRLTLAVLLVVATAGSAFAQDAPQSGTDGGYIAAFGGAVFGPPTEPVFSVEYGEDFHPNAQAYVTLSYFENLMTDDLAGEIDELASDLTALTGDRWTLQGRDRGLSFTGGAKYLFGDGGVRPYVGGGAGIMNLRRTVIEARLGDVTAAVFNDFEVGSSDLSLAPGPGSITRPMAEAVVGVAFPAGRTIVDAGYRYRRVFRMAESLDFSQFTIGFGYRF